MCITIIVIAALVERYSGVQETASVPQIFVGAFVAGSILMALSYVLPEFSVGLAAVATVTMVVSKGQPFWDAINKVFKKSSATPNPPTSPLQQQTQAEMAYSRNVAKNYSSQPLPQQGA